MLSQPRSTEPRPVLNKIGVVDVGAASYGVQEQRLAVVDHARASLFAIMAKSGDLSDLYSRGYPAQPRTRVRASVHLPVQKCTVNSGTDW